MLTFTLMIECENDAFTGDSGQPSAVIATVEVGRILEELSAKIARDGHQHGAIWDVNGNRVGKYEFIGSGQKQRHAA